MANPYIHSLSSVKRWGGEVNDYLKLHEKMDCSKAYFPTNVHRALTHTLFWVFEVMIPIFGSYITNSSGKEVSVKDICELHILEDYRMKFIPTVQDWLQEIELKDWMQNGFRTCPESHKKVYKNCEIKEPPQATQLIKFDDTNPKIENIVLDKASSFFKD